MKSAKLTMKITNPPFSVFFPLEAGKAGLGGFDIEKLVPLWRD